MAQNLLNDPLRDTLTGKPRPARVLGAVKLNLVFETSLPGHVEPRRLASEILGNSSTQVYELYSHLSLDVMDRAMSETFGTV